MSNAKSSTQTGRPQNGTSMSRCRRRGIAVMRCFSAARTAAKSSDPSVCRIRMAATCIEVPVTSHASSITSLGLSRSTPIRAVAFTPSMLTRATSRPSGSLGPKAGTRARGGRVPAFGPNDPYDRAVARVSIEGVNTTARMGVERLSPNDVMELACDVTGTSMQVAAILILHTEGSLDLAAVRAALKQRITAIPRLRQRLMDVPFCGRPVWVDDFAFDINNHIDSVGCAAPGDGRALMDVAAETVTRPLLPGRPLWSATLVTGLAEGSSALVVVFHHVLADGIGGLAVLAHLVDGLPVVPDRGFPDPPPHRRDLWVDALRSRVRALGRLRAGARSLRAATAELRAGRAGRPPRCSLNRPTGRRRALAVVRADLAAVLAVAHARGGTVNDVVLTAVTGALR